MSTDTKVAEKAMEFAKVASRTLEVANAIINQKKASEKVSLERIPQVVNALKQAGLIDEHECKQASVELSSHEDALAILHNVAREYVNAKTAAKKSASVDVGQAVASSGPTHGGFKVVKNASVTGGRLGENELSEADYRLINRILPGALD